MSSVPLWADPEMMTATYALLYNVHVCCGAPYLPSLMEERVWRLVYGDAAVRPRNLCWAYASGDADSEMETAAFVYKKQRSTPDERSRMRSLRTLIGELRSNGADLEARALQHQITRAQRELAQLEKGGDTEFFLRPARTIERKFAGGQRAFEAQVHDGYLCALHAFNNVANSVVLSPPDLLQSIELLRSLTTRFASTEELMLAALREGVFLLPLKVSTAAELGALDRDQPFPRRKYALELIERAGGMIILQKRPEPNPGHFVALVHDSAAATADEENDYEWAVYSYDRIVAHGPTAADAIDEFVFGVLAEACEDDDAVERAYALPTREERRRALEKGRGGGDSQATFFIGLLPVCLEALCEDSQQSVRFENLDADAAAWRYMLRSIVRRSLSEMSVVSYGDADECDLKVAEPVSPATLDAIWMLFSDSARARVPEQLRFDGMDGVNAASAIAVRLSVDEQLNAVAEQLARAVLVADADAARDVLTQTRSMLRELPALGLLFTMRDNFRKFCRLVDNTHWFRLLALSLSTTSILSVLAAAAGAGSTSRDSWRSLTVLFVRLAHSDLRTLGVNMSSTPATSKLYDRSLDTYDLALDLLRQCATVGRAPLPSLELFERGESDDGDTSSEATFVALLRQTLFSMPFENNSFGIIERIAPEQPHNAPTRAAIAAHFSSTARHFVGAVYRRDMALALVDALAFDPRFAGTPEELDEATRETHETHRLDDDWRPRFVERMVQIGIPTVHRYTFGALITQPDERAPILTNIERLPLPSLPGRWMSTRPLLTPEVFLETAPLTVLPDLREAGRESLRRSNAVKRRREATALDRQD